MRAWLNRLFRRQHLTRISPVKLPEGFQDYPGKWVAMRDGAVIDVRSTPDELVEALERKGILDAVVMRVPTEHDKELVGLG